jgi:mobile intron protein
MDLKNYLNEFLSSDLGLLDFCKSKNLERNTFEKLLNNSGYYWKIRRSGKKVKAFKKAIDFYKTHTYNPSLVAKKFGINPQSFTKDLKEFNIFDASKNDKLKNYNEFIFDVIDTEEKAYWLGFIFADGYIYSSPLKESDRIDYNFELCSSGDDIEHMEKFAKFISYNKELKITKSDKNGHTRCRICLSSKHLWNTLNNLGCTPNKSLTLKFPDKKIFKKQKFILDFIRGYIDGDGWITYINKEHTKMCFGLLGTKEFISEVQSIFNTNYAIFQNHKENEITMKLVITGNKGLNILHQLYSNSNIYLMRKYEKYLEYCRLFEESNRLLSSKIGEGCDANPEVN